MSKVNVKDCPMRVTRSEKEIILLMRKMPVFLDGGLAKFQEVMLGHYRRLILTDKGGVLANYYQGQIRLIEEYGREVK
jgi:hypothetical protein